MRIFMENKQIELLIIPFYIIYLIEAIKGYKNISFKEAYRKEQDFDYLKRRKIFAMWRKTIYNVKIKSSL
jgi:hypothetical protein